MPSGVYKRNSPSWHKGRKRSEESKQKMVLSHLGKTLPDEQKRKISESCIKVGAGKWLKGRKRPDISKAQTGKKRTQEHKANISKGVKEGLKKFRYPNKVDLTCYELGHVHYWIKKVAGKPKECTNCPAVHEDLRKMHWHNISGRYLKDLSDWKRLCYSCHYKAHRPKQV